VKPRCVIVLLPKHLGRALRRVRKERQLTLQDACRITKVSRSAFSRVENGKPPNVTALIKLSAFVLFAGTEGEGK